MAELYLVRHGQAGKIGGDYDRVSDLGRQQSSLLGSHLSALGLGFDRVARGELRRHKETLEPLLSAMSLEREAEVLPGLNEFDFQSLGKAYLAVNEEPPNLHSDGRVFFRTIRKALLAWSRDELPRELLVETWEEFHGRVEAAIKDLCDPARAERVLAVSSGGTIAMAMGVVLGLKPETSIALNLQVKNSAYSRFIFTERAIYLHSFNAITHLERPEHQDLVTYF